MNYDDASAREFALDTGRSVIVQAPAGSGKTTLLVSRYLRLLAQVDQPEQVLAITFTKKAAAEMRQRVLDAFAGASPQAQAAIDRARELDWRIEAQPHRLKIQTIDGFAMGLVRRLPIGSGFGMDVGFLEDATPLYDQAVFRLFDKLNTSDPLAQTLADFLALLDNDYALARALLVSMLAKRDQWL